MDTRWFVVSAGADAWPLALDEVEGAAPVRNAQEVGEGVWLLETGIPFAEVAEAWRVAPPIFVRHVHPVQRVLGLAGDADDPASLVARLAQDGQLATQVNPDEPFSVQSRIFAELPYKPFALNEALSAFLAESTGASLDVRNPLQVVSVTVASLAGQRRGEGFELAARRAGLFPRGEHTEGAAALALVGVSRVADNLSAWAGGMHRFAREAEQVSRSEFKLLEAFDVFGIHLPERGVALDLGASPGGWTRILRKHGQYVTAVDPGELDARVDGDAGVRHKRMTAEEYLRGEPDRFDVIVNDMRMDARDSARLMVSFARCLYSDGIVLMTLKLPQNGALPVLQHALEILAREYEVAGARQLFHNRSEVTVYLRRAAAGAAQSA